MMNKEYLKEIAKGFFSRSFLAIAIAYFAGAASASTEWLTNGFGAGFEIYGAIAGVLIAIAFMVNNEKNNGTRTVVEELKNKRNYALILAITAGALAKALPILSVFVAGVILLVMAFHMNDVWKYE